MVFNVLVLIAIVLLTIQYRRLVQKVAYLEQQEFDGRVNKLFNFLTEGLDPDDDD